MYAVFDPVLYDTVSVTVSPAQKQPRPPDRLISLAQGLLGGNGRGWIQKKFAELVLVLSSAFGNQESARLLSTPSFLIIDDCLSRNRELQTLFPR